MRRGFIQSVVLGTLALCFVATAPNTAYAVRLYTSGTADGTQSVTEFIFPHAGQSIYRNHWNNGASLSTYFDSSESWMGDGIMYTYQWSDIVVEVPIGSVRGNLSGKWSARLWFYCLTPGGSDLYSYGYDGDGIVADYSDFTRHTFVSHVPVVQGWIAMNVTSQLQQKINAGYDWAIFGFKGSGTTLAASEDSEGRGAYLEIVPEPSGLMALILGTAGLPAVIIRRRRG